MPSGSDEDEPLRPLNPAVEAALVDNHRAFQRFLVRRLGRKADADDVLQDFYLRALTKAYAIRRDESIVAWLYRCLGSALSDHLRRDARRARHVAAFAREQATQSETVDHELHAMVCDCVYKLLPTLRSEYAEVLRRIDLDGEQRSRVAAALGLTMNNLAVRLHRARRALKQALLLSCTTCPEHGFLDCACDLPIRRLAAQTPTT